MEKQQKDEVFKAFTAKAVQRLKDKKVRKYETLYVPSIDQNIKIRNLDYPEIVASHYFNAVGSTMSLMLTSFSIMPFSLKNFWSAANSSKSFWVRVS